MFVAGMSEPEREALDNAEGTNKPGISPEGTGQVPGTTQSSSSIGLDVTVG